MRPEGRSGGGEDGNVVALTFTDRSAQAGIDAFRHVNGARGDKWFPESMGSGGGFFDYDGDGWMDLLLLRGGTWDSTDSTPMLWLYRNDGAGTFTLRTDDVGLGGVTGYGLGMAAADIDNDGDQDLYVTTLGKDLLFRNDRGAEGARVFTEIGEAAGVAGASMWSSSALFFDADRDGHLDLYVGGYVRWTPETDIWCSLDGETKGYCTPETYQGAPGRFYHNNGDGTFAERTREAGFLPAPGKTLGVAEFDFNRDGWPDLVVANDTQPNLLYVNDGDGTFTERGSVSGMAYDENGKARAGMGIDTGVVDDTGEETIFVGNFSKETIGVFRHLQDGLFLDRAKSSRVGQPSLMTLTFGLFLFDGDLDGDLDLFTANGHVQPEIEHTQEGIGYAEAPHLFINLGDATFEDQAARVGGVLAQHIVARGAAFADYDRDGDLDVLVTENDGPAHLWRNDLSHDTTFLRVHTRGVQSNRDGIGAQVVVVTGETRQQRRVRTGSSYLSQSETPVTFGLGGARRVDSLLVYWPSGRVDRYGDVAGGREVIVTEGSRALTPRSMEGREAPGSD